MSGPNLDEQSRQLKKEEVRFQFGQSRAPAQPQDLGATRALASAAGPAWGLGVLFLSTRLIGGWLLIQRLTRRATRQDGEPWVLALQRIGAQLGLRQAVGLLESSLVEVPMVVGWWRPVILLPATALTGLPSDQLVLILGHELTHILHHDYLVNLVQSLIETLLFYHPAVWWISARIREERENRCDDQAVELCGNRLDYARALTALETLRAGNWSLAPSAQGGSLLARIRRILGVEPSRGDARAGAGRNLDLDHRCLPGSRLAGVAGNSSGPGRGRGSESRHRQGRHGQWQGRRRSRCLAGRRDLSPNQGRSSFLKVVRMNPGDFG